ncbi:MAG: DNA translocase FtsK 4TM domain-containing protein [Phascolarctobacterium sp.]
MAKKRVQRKQQQHTDSRTAAYVAGGLFLVGLVTAAGIVLEAEGGFLGFVAKCELYLLGKGSFVLPLTCFLLSWKLYWDGKLGLWQKKTLALFLVMLCLLGTAHHVFVPVKEELTPHLLPEGGGLVGGLLVLPLHRYAGNIGSWVALVLGWLCALELLLPVGTIWSWLTDLVAAITGKSDGELEAALQQETEKPQKQKQQSKPTTRNIFKDASTSKPARPEGKAAIQKVYRSGEFGSFTDGIEKKRSLKSFLGVIDNPYEQEPVKQELEKDPIQLPEWQDNPQEVERERNIVLRPVINYDATEVPATGRKPVEGTAPEAAAQPQLGNESAAGTSTAPRSIIHNEYREQKEAASVAKQSPRSFDFELETEAEHEAEGQPGTMKHAGAPSESAREIAIYDSADKIQGAEPESAAVPAQAEPTSAAAAADGSQTAAAQPAYLLPPLELLSSPKVSDPASYQRDIMEQCAILEQTLADFRVRAKVIAVTRGPSVTRFELEPAPGVKVSSVVNLADDIALRLAAPGVRIEAPIPGKSAIGIEAPNTKNDTVCFREVVEDAKVRLAPSKLCIGLGKDISGDIISADLSKMPHLLVAGSTGSGKSVCINTIIAGILYKARPEEVKLILVDPKVVELSNYNGIPHLLTPVVTEPKKAASALHWAVAEMERRYNCFAESHVREINSYNAQAEEKMPFIVIIIDELSDLMMVAKVDVEDAILRLAQKARAAGIHLILATQRPSVDVITGIVKANIPSRIAFAVSSQTDSRTIIDMGGAEKLLGKGDMLFYPIGFNKPVRVQGAFVTDEELNKIVEFIVQQSIPVNYTEEVTEQELECDSKNKNNGGEDVESDSPAEDELFADALSLVLDMGQASSSMLQRRFRIGYTRAARLVDTMEELGIVGQSVGSKPREVIMSRQEAEERFLKHD